MSTPGSVGYGYRRTSESGSIGRHPSSSYRSSADREKAKREKEREREKGVVSNDTNTYKLANELGRGAFAVVYEGMNIETGVSVALKRFPLASIDAATIESIDVR